MSSYKHPFIVQTESISLPASEYKEPELPKEIIDETLFKQASYGLEMKNRNFLLADNIHFLNHGSFGATPRFIHHSTRRFQDILESQPVRFFQNQFKPWMVAALRRLAPFVNAPSAESLVFVDNATSGVLSAVTSMDWKHDDSLLYLNIGYGPIIKFLKNYSAKMGFKLIEVNVSVPVDISALVSTIDAHLHSGNTKTRLAIVDHITSGTGLILPIKQIIDACHAKDVQVCVDGAHAIGQIEVDLKHLGADYYVSNLHKWLFASKGCAFFYVDQKHWKNIHPVLATEGAGFGLHAEFSWAGTKDYAPWLSTFAALEFYQKAGGASIRSHNHELAVWAGKMLMESWKTNFSVKSDDFSQHVGSLVSIRVPVNKSFADAMEAAAHAEWLNTTLWDKYKVEVPVSSIAGVVYLRISAQIYNTKEDYFALRDAIKELYELH